MTATPPTGPSYLKPFVLKASDDSGIRVEEVGNVDLHRPDGEARRPAILFVHGGPVADLEVSPREWPVFRGYGAAAARLGVVGAVVEHSLVLGVDRLAEASDDLEAAIGVLRSDPQVDPQRIALWFFSGGALLAGEWMDSRPEWLQCVALSYPVLDPAVLDPQAKVKGFVSATEVVAREPDLPVVLIRVGGERPEFAAGVEKFIAAAGTGLQIVDVPDGPHGFDHDEPTEQAGQAVQDSLEKVVAILTGGKPAARRTRKAPAKRTRSTRTTSASRTTSRTTAVTTTPTQPSLSTATAQTEPILPDLDRATESLATSASYDAGAGAEQDVQTAEALVVDRQLGAYATGDLEAFLDLYSPTAEIYPRDGKLVRGRRALREYFQRQLETGRARIEVQTRMTQGEWVVDRQVIHGLDDEPVTAIVIHRVQHGAITEVRYLA